MATKAIARHPLWTSTPKSPTALAFRAKPTYISSQRPIHSSAPVRPTFRSAQRHSEFRRSYADSVAPVIKRRGRGFFRWTWRLTYLSAIGGVAYLSYNIYSLRTPQDQFEPDPSKKTLVVLGRCNYDLESIGADYSQVPAGAQYLC